MDDDLEDLRLLRPSWSLWFGEATGKYRAAPLWPGAPLEMCEGRTLAELEDCLEFYERTH